MAKKLIVLIAAAAVTVISSLSGVASVPKVNDLFRLATVGPQKGGGEPSIAAAKDGALYISYPGPGTGFYSSVTDGAKWIKGATADTGSGVDTVTADKTFGEGTNQSVEGTAVDAAGNSASTTVSGVNVDETAPTLSGAPTSWA